MKKVLILTASPQRDKIIDELISRELRKRDCEVWVRPCLREGRDAVMELQPDVVVVPPVRNPYAVDFVNVMLDWGIGVVSRHTEASCDWQDWKKMPHEKRLEILGRFPYTVSHELVWSQDEAQILQRRNRPINAVPVGAFVADIYKSGILEEILEPHEVFCEKRKLDKEKKILLIASPWGFADSAPDLTIPEAVSARMEEEGQKRHLEMIKHVSENLPEGWQMLVTTHPGVVNDKYKEELGGIVLDTESTAAELLKNSSMLIHAGSTMAMEAHFLDIPSIQFGDVNRKESESWWAYPESGLSKISPYCKTKEEVVSLVNELKDSKDNANQEALANLESGRYGVMDGQATVRSAEIIASVEGKMKMRWPKATNDYDQLFKFKLKERIVVEMGCAICKRTFYVVNPQWMQQLATRMKQRGITDLSEQFKVMMQEDSFCPNCAAKIVPC